MGHPKETGPTFTAFVRHRVYVHSNKGPAVVFFTMVRRISSRGRRTAAALVVRTLVAFGVIGSSAVRLRSAAGPHTRIDDLDVPAAEILALCPDVAKIEVLVRAKRPTHRIIQIADCHYFAREDYRVMSRVPSEEGFSQHARNVEELQKTQLRLLCWLVDYHGLNEVFQEGDWDQWPKVEDNVRWLRDWYQLREKAASEVVQLRREIDKAEAHGKDATSLRTRKRAAERYVEWGLLCGACRRLLVLRPSVMLLPAEDKECFESLPRPEIDMTPHDAAIVQILLSRSKCAVIVLGAAHDLSEQIKRLGGGRCEYVRVIPRGLAECAEHLRKVKNMPPPRGIFDP